MPLPRAGAGISPRRARYFSLLRQRKVPKRKATQLSAAPAGQPASGSLRGAPWNSLRAARCTQTTTASQFTKHACPAARMPPRKHPATGATRWEFVAGLCFARPGGDEALRARPWGPSAATARVEVCSHPVEAGPRSAGFGGSGIALFERSEFSETPPNSSTAGCPERSAGTQTAGRLSFGYFSLAKQRRSTSPAGARPGLRPHRRARQ